MEYLYRNARSFKYYNNRRSKKFVKPIARYQRNLMLKILVAFDTLFIIAAIFAISFIVKSNAADEFGSVSPTVPFEKIEYSMIDLAPTPSVGVIETAMISHEPEVVEDYFGNTIFEFDDTTFVSLPLPSVYYADIDFSSFMPYMDYRAITNTKSKGYKVCRSENAYTDENGFRRYAVSEDEFSVGMDDYLVAMGTFYKEHGTIGNRYLIVTTTGCYTVRTGDEKADCDTDEMNMFTLHRGYAGVLEWIIDDQVMDRSILSSGTVTKSDLSIFDGEIIYIYQITEGGDVI